MKFNKSIWRGIKISLRFLLFVGLAAPVFAEKKLNSIALTVGDLGNVFFVQIAHGAEAQAKKYNPAVTFTAQSSNYDVNIQSTISLLRFGPVQDVE
jgi:ribose transport system substrate-binding protein